MSGKGNRTERPLRYVSRLARDIDRREQIGKIRDPE
jgi:hypothetical protein